MFHEKFNQKDLATQVFKQKWFMWKKKFVYGLNYLITLKVTIHGRTHGNKKSHVDDSCLLQSFYSDKVAGTIMGLGLPMFTEKGVSPFIGIKQKKWTPPLNSAYSN